MSYFTYPIFFTPNFLALKNHFIDELTQARDTLLACDNDFALMKHAVDQLYRLFNQITGVSIHHLNEDKDILLPSGKAISTAAAAHCLLEMKRTAVFLRGINDAIVQALDKNEETPIRILYAGTGPYGTLVLPLLTLYKPTQLVVDWLDINPQSLTALQKVIDAFKLQAYVGEVYCADATTFAITRPYDIVISETMQAALKKEPQVAIMQNLIPQLEADAVFIPQRITIDAVLSSSGTWNETSGMFENIERIALGEVMTINAHQLTGFTSTFSLPAQPCKARHLQLLTTIGVFGQHVLGENDCSLNMPLRVCEITHEWGQTLQCDYQQGEVPHVAIRFSGDDKVFALKGRNSLSVQ